jgi:Ion channel
MGAIEQDVTRFPLLHDLAQVMPFMDLVFGGSVLVFVILVHALGIRAVNTHVVHRSQVLMARRNTWLVDFMMLGSVCQLLLLHVVEIVIWSAALAWSGVVPEWRVAGFFAGNTYTTIGYGTFVLPLRWGMLAPIIAMSGLFAFGWSCAVLVDIVERCQKIRDAALAMKSKSS